MKHLIASPLKFRNAAIGEKPRLYTEGMVRVLCAEANARHEQRPKFSREIAATAYEVATKLTGAAERQQHNLMGMALREHANALRYLGQFKDALKMLDYAEKLFVGVPGADPFDLAIVAYIRAGVLQNLGRFDEGISTAKAAAEVFRNYGDVARERCAVMVEANCVLRSGRAAEAVVAYEQVIALSRASGDARMLARALSNCAAALKDLGQFDRAERYFTEALSLYDEFDMPTEKARVEWVLAMILVTRGEVIEGASRLDFVRKEMAKLGLTNDAALATLMWAEARLVAGTTAGVAEACGNIIMVFENQDMHRQAKHALAVLNEAIAAGNGTPQLVREVLTYLEATRSTVGKICGHELVNTHKSAPRWHLCSERAPSSSPRRSLSTGPRRVHAGISQNGRGGVLAVIRSYRGCRPAPRDPNGDQTPPRQVRKTQKPNHPWVGTVITILDWLSIPPG